MFESEISIHFPELNNLKKRPILAFPNLLICLDCGFMESRIENSKLRELTEDSGDTKRVG